MNMIIGDLLDFPDDLAFIAHGCNTMNVMGAGLAKQVADRYPEAFAADTAAHKARAVALGKISMARVTGERRWVVNLYQQDSFGKLNLLALEKSLVCAMEALLDKEQAHEPEAKWRIGVPYKLGCGLARGNWVEVMAVISKVEKLYPDRIIIVKREQDD